MKCRDFQLEASFAHTASSYKYTTSHNESPGFLLCCAFFSHSLHILFCALSFSSSPFDELTCSSEESGITSGFFSSPSPSSSLWLPPLLLLDPGDPLYRMGFDVIFKERWASDWPLFCRWWWWWWCRECFLHFDRRRPIRMAQPPIKRADAMPMAIDIVGVSDRYNFGRSAASGKQKCCMYYQDNNKRVVLFNRMWSCMDMVHYGSSAV